MKPKWIIIAGIVAVLVTCLFPPWVRTFEKFGYGKSTTPIGFHFLLSAPPVGESSATFGVRIDFARLVMESVCIGAAVAIACLVIPSGLTARDSVAAPTRKQWRHKRLRWSVGALAVGVLVGIPLGVKYEKHQELPIPPGQIPQQADEPSPVSTTATKAGLFDDLIPTAKAKKFVPPPPDTIEVQSRSTN